MDKQLRAAIKAMAAHQIEMAAALQILLLNAREESAADELVAASDEFEGLMGNLTYE